MTAAWLDFWDASDATYINARHKDVHYRLIASDLAALVPFPQARVLDYGCGDALHADIVAAAAGELVLFEAAPRMRARLAARFGAGQTPKIRVLAPEEMQRLPDQSFDLIVLHSVIQYLTRNETEALLCVFHRLLQPNGRRIIGATPGPSHTSRVRDVGHICVVYRAPAPIAPAGNRAAHASSATPAAFVT